MNSLPHDVVLLITEHLDTLSIVNLSCVNKRMYMLRKRVKFWLNLLATFWNDVVIRNDDNSFLDVDKIRGIVMHAYAQWLAGTHISRHDDFNYFDDKKVVDYDDQSSHGRGILMLTRGPLFAFGNPCETIYMKDMYYRMNNDALVVEPDRHVRRYMPRFAGNLVVQKKRIKQLHKHTNSIMTIDSWTMRLGAPDLLLLNVTLKSVLYKQSVKGNMMPHPDFAIGEHCRMMIKFPAIGVLTIKVRKPLEHDYYDVSLFSQRDVRLIYDIKYFNDEGNPKFAVMKCQNF